MASPGHFVEVIGIIIAHIGGSQPAKPVAETPLIFALGGLTKPLIVWGSSTMKLKPIKNRNWLKGAIRTPLM